MNHKNIIAFAGRKRSGKGVLCNEFVRRYDAKIITIANYLKYLCCELIDCDYKTLNIMKDDGTVFEYHVNDRWIDIINKRTGIDKEIIKKELGNIVFKSVRQMLQIIGTDFIRKYNVNWHCNMMLKEINETDNNFIVIDDVRFENEKRYIEDIGGIVFFIIRPDNDSVSNHRSEYSLSWRNFNDDRILINDKSVQSLIESFTKFYDNNYKTKIFKSSDDYKDNDKRYIKNLYYKVSNPSNKEYNPYLAEDLKLYI